MPAESSHPTHTRRASRKLTTDEEIDIRRARGEISCAECRRLKLKCDKKLPCSSCVRRGCPSICPNGSLSTGQGTRFVLADTTQLHAKIAEMGQRIRQLEDALTIFQSGVSNECHPLLREELLSIKFGPEKGYVPEREQQSMRKPSVESTIDALGTMTIGDQGDAKYFGPSAGSETLFLAGAELEESTEEDYYSPVSMEIARLSAAFPFGADGNMEKGLDLLFEYLPSQPRAWSLCETYMEQAAWSFRPIKRDEIIDDILSPIYKIVKEKQFLGSTNDGAISPHRLAVLFLVFALGALVDLTLEPQSNEAENYYHLSCACLSLRSVFDSPEIATVQAVLLMAAYHGMAGKRYTMDSSWSLISLGAKLAQSVSQFHHFIQLLRMADVVGFHNQLGLHRDSARWNMDSKTVERRRGLFWELFSGEQFYNLALGRPPSVRLSYIDCEFPLDEEATLDAEGNSLKGYYQWKYEFTKDIFASVIELTLTAEAPQYQTILELDRKVREKTLPQHLNVFISPEDEHCTPSIYMKKCLLGQYRSITLLYLHRSFFAQAMLDHPTNPLRSPYAPSFLAAYRCASGVIKSSLNHYDRFPELCGRWWGIWTHLFSAAIIVGCIVTRSPSSSMAPSAFIELGLACDLFEKGAMHSRRARSGLAILYKMREKAFHVYSQFRSGSTPVPGILSVGKPDYGDDELALFGGQTRVLVSKLLTSRSGHKKKSLGPSSPSSDDFKGAHETTPDVHPSLVEYLSLFPPQNMSVSTPSDGSAGTPNLHTSPELINQPMHNVGDTCQAQPESVMEQDQQKAWQPWQPSPSIFTPLSPGTYQHISSRFSTSVPSYAAPDPIPNPNYNGLDFKTDPSEVGDLGMMITGESGMDEQWMSFIRESGFLDGTSYGAPMINEGYQH